jgi:hypothetical protein
MAATRTRAGKSEPTAATVLEEARQWLTEKGYRSGQHPYDEGQAWLFQANGKPDLLLCAVDPDTSIDEHQGQLAVLAALTTCGDTPPPYVHVTNGTNASTFQLTNEGERPLVEVPDAAQARSETTVMFSAKTDGALLTAYERLQQQFDNIHEHIYATRENVSSSNEAIDELCKLVFMVTVLHCSQASGERLLIPNTGKVYHRSLIPSGLLLVSQDRTGSRPYRIFVTPSTSAVTSRSSILRLTARTCASSRTAPTCGWRNPTPITWPFLPC